MYICKLLYSTLTAKYWIRCHDRIRTLEVMNRCLDVIKKIKSKKWIGTNCFKSSRKRTVCKHLSGACEEAYRLVCRMNAWFSGRFVTVSKLIVSIECPNCISVVRLLYQPDISFTLFVVDPSWYSGYSLS